MWCSVKDYSDEKIQKILDENDGYYREAITDIMPRLCKIIYKQPVGMLSFI